jgi:ABC-2 type transport system permease protein
MAGVSPSHALSGPVEAVEPDSARGFRLPTVDRETRLFWRLRTQELRNSLVRSPDASRLRAMLVVLLTALLWSLLFVLFADGFRFLNLSISDTATHDETVRAIYSLFFASLMVMLAFSTAIILYGALYCSAEVRFLMTTPTRDERIFVHKFQESMVLSSWVFLLLCSPMLVAYGLVEGAGWFYFAVIVPFMVAFAFIPGTWGAWVCMMVVRRLPANRVQFLIVAGLAMSALAVALVWLVASKLGRDLLTPGWFQELLTRLKLSEYRLLPSWWLSSGLLEGVHAGWSDEPARRALTESLMFLTLLVSNALFFHLVAVWTARRVFRLGYLLLQGEQTARRPFKLDWLDDAVMHLGVFLPPQLRLMVVKDLRLFRRDPVQWSQFLIFFTLLALYFVNARRLTFDVSYAGWVNMISFLNLAVVGLLLSTFTTRFVYPMISLEGRRFWILGLLPVRRETIIWGKYLFATIGSLFPCLLLILLSDMMLGVDQLVMLVHLLACVLLSSGLSGLAVWLGAKMPNLRHDSPSRIAAGFGGTLTLVLSTVYIVGIVLLTALPCHVYLSGADNPGMHRIFAPGEFYFWLAAGAAASIALGVVTTLVPLWLGVRAFRKLEF